MQGVEAWNAWRAEYDQIRPNLSGANLSNSFLRGVDLSDADLSHTCLLRAVLNGANFRGADLKHANVSETSLSNVDLSGADLCHANVSEANLNEANLSSADLSNADLRQALLSSSKFDGANLSSADLRYALLSKSEFDGAILRNADLRHAVLNSANLNNADLRSAHLGETVFGDIDLTGTQHLSGCNHDGPSLVDHRTLERSNNVPTAFWRGCGLPDWQIATIKLYQPDLSQYDINDVTDEIFRLRADRPIQLYSCFISYSSEDRAFARSLHDDLQNAGVRCWFDEHDLKTGDRLRDVIDKAIRTRDKLLLIFSEASIASGWVENEVETALEEERASSDRMTILFPIKIDDAVMETELAWARMIKRDRHITDMTGWNEEVAYQQGLERLLRDLRADPEANSSAA